MPIEIADRDGARADRPPSDNDENHDDVYPLGEGRVIAGSTVTLTVSQDSGNVAVPPVDQAVTIIVGHYKPPTHTTTTKMQTTTSSSNPTTTSQLST